MPDTTSTQPTTAPVSPSQAIGLILRSARSLTTYSQRGLSEALGWGEETYRRYEIGERPLDVDKLYAVAELLEVSPLQVLQDAESRFPQAFRSVVETSGEAIG